jgi:hypothetical protein
VKARELLGWTPQYGGMDGFKRGLAETIRWFAEPRNLQGYRAGVYTL